MQDMKEKVVRLRELLEAGVLTPEEFEQECRSMADEAHGRTPLPQAPLPGATVAGAAPPAGPLAGLTAVGSTPPPAPSTTAGPLSGPTVAGLEFAPLASLGGPATAGIPERLGSYRVLGAIGAGGMGMVVRARHVEEGWAQRQGGDVAIKLVHPHLASDPCFRERFLDEAQLGRRVQHASLAAVHDMIAEGPWLGMVMTFVEGRPLSDWIRPGGLSMEEALALLRPLAEVLDHLHGQGIVHRDIKPANVKVRPDGVPVILDLGIAKDLRSDAGHTRTATAMGTAAWMAPEQADAKHVTAAADRYAFGLVAYALLAGRMPWPEGTSEARIVVLKLTDSLEPLGRAKPAFEHGASAEVTRMLALEPAGRFPASRAFVNALEAARCAERERQRVLTNRWVELEARAARLGQQVERPLDLTEVSLARIAAGLDEHERQVQAGVEAARRKDLEARLAEAATRTKAADDARKRAAMNQSFQEIGAARRAEESRARWRRVGLLVGGTAAVGGLGVGAYQLFADEHDPIADARRQDEELRTSVRAQNPLPDDAVVRAMLGQHPDMLYVPAGTFIRGRFGSEDPDRASAFEPLREVVQVSGFFIDSFEFPNQHDAEPTTRVTWKEAGAACGAIGKRLCTDEEWEKACKGPRNLIYAYGDDYSEACGVEVGDAHTPGGLPECTSGFGVWNLSSGPREWTASAQPEHEARRMVRGGLRSNPACGTRCAFSEDENVDYSDSTLGFRCCLNGGGTAGVAAGGAPAPTASAIGRVSAGTVKVSDSDPAKVKGTVSQYSGQVKACYEQRLKVNAALAGQVEVNWLVNAGRTTGVEVLSNSTGDDELANCITRKVRAWRFPVDLPPDTDVVYPFILSPG